MENSEIKKIERCERLKIYHELLMNSVWERFKLLPQISALSATLLIVATFNERILILTPGVLILLIILLSLIPLSLIGYMVELRENENHALESISRISRGEEPLSTRPACFTAFLPYIIVAAISIIVVLLILSVIANHLGVIHN